MRLDGGRGDLVVYFSSTRYDGPAGTDRHIATQLSADHPVLYVDPPMSVLSRLRRPELSAAEPPPALRVLGPRLAHVAPRVVPGFSRRGLHHLLPPLMRRAARTAVDDLYGPGPEPVAAIVSSRVDDMWSAVPAGRRLFYSTDDLAAGADLLSVPSTRLLRQESATLRAVDAVAVVSEPLRARYAAAGYAAVVVPNGCDPAAYADVDRAPLPADVDLPGPVAGLVGWVNERIDLDLLEAVADTGHSLLVVGPRAPGYQPRRFDDLAARPNVAWVGPKPFADLPRYLRLIDVGLTPYTDSAFNRASFPLKTLEYLAAGRAAVSTPLPATDWLDTDLIGVAAGPARFAVAVRRALAQPRTPDVVARRRAFAAAHGWNRRARAIAELAGLRVDRGVSA
jgi:teichuronic acid biosynthesis glycosyltransferase TuaH